MLESSTGRRLVPRVATRPGDCSVFGVRDMAGVVRNFTANAAGTDRITRGGAYQALAEQCRIGREGRLRESETYFTVGFRLAQTLRR
jgi:hypothetical protein